jgi:transposase
MYYIGIDVAKHKHYAVVTNSFGDIIVSSFEFLNNSQGFDLLLNAIQPYISNPHLVGLESTGHYGDLLIKFLLNHNCSIGIINPIATDAARKQRIRKTKNDSIDAFVICQVLQSKNYSSMTKNKFVLREGKQLTRYRQELVSRLSTLKTQLQAVLDLSFPEYNSVFKTKYSKAYFAVLKEFPSASKLKKASTTKLKNILDKASKKRINKDYPSLLKQAAVSSIGEDNSINELKINIIIREIESLESNIAMVNRKIEELATSLNSPIFSIPGIGLFTGFSILSELQDISLFSSSKKLIAFAGCDPSVYQSGEFNASRTTISKRGSPYLRLALYQVALTVCNFIPTFKQYYTLKRSQGKSHRCAQSHVVRKILRVIFKLLSENITFNPELSL